MSVIMKNYKLNRKMIDSLNSNLNILNSLKLNKKNTKALKIIAIISSIYDSNKVFDSKTFDLLDLFDSGQLDKIITKDVVSSYDYDSFEKLHFKGVYIAIQVITFLISSILPEHKGLSKLCIGVTWVDDVVRIEFKQHKLTLLQYEDRFRLLNLYNKQNKKTTWFKESFFDNEDEMYTYLNNIEEYAEYSGDVLEMIKY